MADYDVKTVTFPLASADVRHPIVQRAVGVVHVAVVSMDAPLLKHVFVHFGQDGPGIRIVAETQAWQLTRPQRDGVYLSMDATAPVGTIEMLASFEPGGTEEHD